MFEWAQDAWAKLQGNDEDEDEDEWGMWYEEMGDLVHSWRNGEELTEEEIHRMNELNKMLGDLEDGETGEKRSWFDNF